MLKQYFPLKCAHLQHYLIFIFIFKVKLIIFRNMQLQYTLQNLFYMSTINKKTYCTQSKTIKRKGKGKTP